jgi:DNA excision repair protein ERCC-4
LEAGSGGDFDAHYGLLAPAQTVLVRAAADDGDDRLLHELRPRFIVLFEPVLESVRRIEVRLACMPFGLRVLMLGRFTGARTPD